MPSPSREFTPDLLKALCIIGVVFIHTTWLFDDPGVDSSSWLFRAAVPCFLILSAYFLESKLSRDSEDGLLPAFVRKRLLHLGGIYFIWSLLYLLGKETWSMPTVSTWLIRHFSGSAWKGQYFFLILLQIVAAHGLLRRIYAIPRLRTFSLFACFTLYAFVTYRYEHLPWLIKKLDVVPGIYHLPYVFAGIALRRGHLPRLHPLFAFGVLLIPLEFYALSTMHMRYAIYLTPGVLIGSLLTTITLMQQDFGATWNEKFRKFAQDIGKKSMSIFVTNPAILGVVALLWGPTLHESSPTALNIALALFITLATVALAVLSEKLIRILRLNGLLN